MPESITFPLCKNLSREHQTLLALAHARPLSAPMTSPVDWDRLLRLAQNHGVDGLLNRNAGSIALPDDFRHKLARNVRMRSMRTLAQAARLIELLSLFDRLGIRALALKGLHLGLTLYGDASTRPHQDIDIFVDRADVPRIHAALVGNGYAIVDQLTLPESVEAARFLRSTQDNEYSYKFDQDGSHIELHWALIRSSFGTILTFDEAWSERRSVDFGGRSIPGFSNAHQFLFLAVHGTKHLWRRMEWIVSLRRLAEMLSPDEWKRVWELARSRGLSSVVQFSVFVVNEFCPDDAPIAIVPYKTTAHRVHSKLIRETLGAAGGDGTLPDSGKWTFYAAVRGGCAYHVASWCRHALMPSHRDLAALPPGLRRAPFYWAIRPFRLALAGRRTGE